MHARKLQHITIYRARVLGLGLAFQIIDNFHKKSSKTSYNIKIRTSFIKKSQSKIYNSHKNSS